MTESPRNLTLGTVNGGNTAIVADVTSVSNVGVAVTLSTDYAIAARPPGYPSRPSMTGVDAGDLDFPKTVPSGTTITVAPCEAAALVAAGAAVAV